MNGIIVMTNNKTLFALKEHFKDITVEYMDEPVRNILRHAQQRLTEESMTLLCNPLCGRSARPFPYISLILEEFSGQVSVDMWNDLMTFEMMDEKNRKIYELYPENIAEDFAELDRSLVESALEKLLG